MSLMTSRRLGPLLLTQTLSAFNDNLLKNALVVLILFRASQSAGPALVALAGGVFILPYALLSATAGQVADRFEKSAVLRRVKWIELAIMAVAVAGFLLDSTALLFAVLGGLGLQATFLSPLKNALLPDHLAEHELVAGNGLIEAGTFLGILAGTLAGSLLITLPHGAAIVSVLGVVVAVGGIVSAMGVPPAPVAAPDLRIGWNIVAETVALLRLARQNRPVWLCILGLSWFWTVGATLLAELPTLVRQVLGASEHVLTLLLVFFSVGAAIGSALCGRLLKGEVSARLVPFAGIGLSVFMWDFGHAAAGAAGLADVGAVLRSPAGWRMLADVTLLAACGGVFSVPLYAVMQDRAEPDRLARTVGANNVANAAAIAVAAGITAVLALWGVGPVAILLLTAALNLLVAFWIMRILPRDTVRALFRFYFLVFHRARVSGLENLPPTDTRSVVVVNHQSFLDGCFVAAFLPGEPVFAVNVHIARRWWARLFLAAVRHFPVDPANPFSTRAMVKAVRDGQRLVIFPEGRITVTGALMKVYEGAGMVAEKAEAAIVPVRIDGLQYTKLSRMGGLLRRRWFPHLTLTVREPVALSLAPDLFGRARRRAVAGQLQAVMERGALATAPIDRTLWTALVDAAARNGGGTPILEDIARAPLTYRKLVLGATVLGRRLAGETTARQIGLMLPNANAAVAAFMGLQAFGRVPAMLNYSAGAEAMLSACAAAEVDTVVSSRAFVEKGKLAAVVERMGKAVRFVWLEDVRAGIGRGDKLRGWLLSLRPRRLPGAAGTPDAPAVVLFTSGSEGAPKGVVLSHRNLLANIAQVAAVIDFTAADRVFNAMPMFHSFGLTGGTLLPLLSGVRCFLYPSPLHYRIVPELIYDTDATVAFGTDTFLTGWARFAHSYDFRSVRYMISGAEKVRDETRRTYAERFGVRVLEGYGATETAPVLALNTPMTGRPGTAGRLLPGIEHRLDPVGGIEGGGRLVVRGPNVMLGYLRHTAPGVLEVPEGGWYDTGDICAVDGQGFVSILARAKRFAKIAGEMVSMPAAEALAVAAWPDAQHAVVSVPDARKGEALVLLTTQADAAPGVLLAQARERGTPEIAVPRTVRVVAGLPLLGTGKVDYVAATRLAREDDEAAAAG